ncbi:(deoxy)nucleoside triphosphate pyrophosphohydrolase [uncultured Desulfuromonas sp.]|uniref:(deoxy)nucleoside triphosphate pyrophosphohydrolase n=1 Tax=uncultured Desulfuromonas sp. TaxID=181013 RepID=UPI002637CA7F|nr:(deoxy)nucleoside triphosphate pyrophosphohydrolase [uncultured Desulfuromonas sp.]
MLPLLVTAAIIRKEKQVLITRRPEGSRHAGLWEFPGGKLDDDESPQDCLRREIREELDLEVAVGPILEVAYYRYDWGPVLVLAFECRPLGNRIRNLEVAEHRWVRPEALADFDILPADRPIIEKLLCS